MGSFTFGGGRPESSREQRSKMDLPPEGVPFLQRDQGRRVTVDGPEDPRVVPSRKGRIVFNTI
jgi:hypothetical protein